MDGLKTMMNIGKNTCNDYALPVRQTLEKSKTHEVRTYETNKYIMVTYETTESNDPKAPKPKSESKQGNDDVMKIIWKVMKYTQGENEDKKNMKLLMPVFVQAETLSENHQGKDEKLIQVKVFISLPKEYQEVNDNPDKQPIEPPKPNDPDITFETIKAFKCFVGTFGGFATDQVYKNETEKLKKSLSNTVSFHDSKVICISYDPPFKLFGRTNEVLLIATEE